MPLLVLVLGPAALPFAVAFTFATAAGERAAPTLLLLFAIVVLCTAPSIASANAVNASRTCGCCSTPPAVCTPTGVTTFPAAGAPGDDDTPATGTGSACGGCAGDNTLSSSTVVLPTRSSCLRSRRSSRSRCRPASSTAACSALAPPPAAVRTPTTVVLVLAGTSANSTVIAVSFIGLLAPRALSCFARAAAAVSGTTAAALCAPGTGLMSSRPVRGLRRCALISPVLPGA